MSKPVDDKKRRKVVAITRELKKQKGIVMKKSGFEAELQNLKNEQAKIAKIVEGENDQEVLDAAHESNAKLQNIVDDINLYMGIIYPEGLMEIDTEETGVAVSISG